MAEIETCAVFEESNDGVTHNISPVKGTNTAGTSSVSNRHVRCGVNSKFEPDKRIFVPPVTCSTLCWNRAPLRVTYSAMHPDQSRESHHAERRWRARTEVRLGVKEDRHPQNT